MTSELKLKARRDQMTQLPLSIKQGVLSIEVNFNVHSQIDKCRTLARDGVLPSAVYYIYRQMKY